MLNADMKIHPGVTGALVLGALTLVIIQVLSEQQALDFLTAILVAGQSGPVLVSELAFALNTSEDKAMATVQDALS